MNLPFFVAKRYIFSKKSRNAINLITGITVLAIAVISFSLVVILSALNGFEGLLDNLYSDFDPDLKIEAKKGKTFNLTAEQIREIENLNGVDFAYASIEENAVIMHGDHKVIATLKGVEPEYAYSSGMNKYIAAGSIDLEHNGKPKAVLGAGIDQKLTSDVNDPYSTLKVYAPRRGDYSINDMDGVQEMFIMPGGVLLMDQIINDKYVIVPLSFARDFFEYETEMSFLEVQLNKDSEEKEIKRGISKIIGNEFQVKNRFEQQESIYKMFKSEKRSTFAILVLILIIATFNLIGALTMMVMEKKKDLGTFKSLGMTPRTIGRIYYFEGVLISFIGSAIGIGLGILAVWLQSKYHLVELENSIVEYYPVNLQVLDVVAVLLITMVLGIITSIYPSYKAAKEMAK